MGLCFGLLGKDSKAAVASIPLLSDDPSAAGPKYSEIIRAAWIIEDSLEGRNADKYPTDAGVVHLREATSKQQQAKRIFDITINLWVLLLFVETPLWCQPSRATREFLTNEQRCPLPDGTVAVTSGLPMIPPDYALVLEVLCLLISTLFLLLEKRWIKTMTSGGLSGFENGRPSPDIFLFILGIAWADMAFFTVVRQSCFRLSPYCRLALLFYQRVIRNVFRSALKCCGEFNNIAFFMIASVVFFTWLLAMILDDIIETDGKRAMEEIGGDAFGSFSAGLFSFFTIMTGAAFPDTIIPLIDKMRMTIFIFISFMLLTFFLFTQLMLAVVYNVYQEDLKHQLQENYTSRSRGLAMAFCMMAIPGRKAGKVMRMETFKQIISSLALFPHMRNHLSMECMSLLCTALHDGSDELSFHEFHVACDLLLYRFWTSPKDSLLQTCFDWQLPWVRRFIKSGSLDATVNWTLAFNGLFIVYESTLEMDSAPEPVWEVPVETFFSCIYVVEVMLKLSVTSFGNYMSQSSDRFDFVVSWLLFSVGILVALPFVNSGSLHDFLPYLNILRMLRLLKLLERTRHFKMMSNCIRNLIRVSEEMCCLLLVTWLLFAAIGVQSFGGKLYPTNPKLVDTDFVSNGYYVLNFHDLGSAVLATFCMMVATYMPEYAEAMNLSIDWPPFFGFAYCALFFFVGVNIVFNIFTAFTIDVFITLKSAEEKDALALAKDHQTAHAEMVRLEETSDDCDPLKIAGEDEVVGTTEVTGSPPRQLSKMRNAEDLTEEGLLQGMHAAIRPGGNRVLHVVLPPRVIRARTLLDVFDDLGTIVRQARVDHAARIGEESRESTSHLVDEEGPWFEKVLSCASTC